MLISKSRYESFVEQEQELNQNRQGLYDYLNAKIDSLQQRLDTLQEIRVVIKASYEKAKNKADNERIPVVNGVDTVFVDFRHLPTADDYD